MTETKVAPSGLHFLIVALLYNHLLLSVGGTGTLLLTAYGKHVGTSLLWLHKAATSTLLQSLFLSFSPTPACPSTSPPNFLLAMMKQTSMAGKAAWQGTEGSHQLTPTWNWDLQCSYNFHSIQNHIESWTSTCSPFCHKEQWEEKRDFVFFHVNWDFSFTRNVKILHGA